jgi:hypothetical protein
MDAGQSLSSTSLTTGVTRLLTRRQPAEVNHAFGSQTSPPREKITIEAVLLVEYIPRSELHTCGATTATNRAGVLYSLVGQCSAVSATTWRIPLRGRLEPKQSILSEPQICSSGFMRWSCSGRCISRSASGHRMRHPCGRAYPHNTFREKRVVSFGCSKCNVEVDYLSVRVNSSSLGYSSAKLCNAASTRRRMRTNSCQTAKPVSRKHSARKASERTECPLDLKSHLSSLAGQKIRCWR